MLPACRQCALYTFPACCRDAYFAFLRGCAPPERERAVQALLACRAPACREETIEQLLQFPLESAHLGHAALREALRRWSAADGGVLALPRIHRRCSSSPLAALLGAIPHVGRGGWRAILDELGADFFRDPDRARQWSCAAALQLAIGADSWLAAALVNAGVPLSGADVADALLVPRPWEVRHRRLGLWGVRFVFFSEVLSLPGLSAQAALDAHAEIARRLGQAPAETAAERALLGPWRLELGPHLRWSPLRAAWLGAVARGRPSRASCGGCRFATG